MNLNEEMLSAWNEPDGVQSCIEVAENYAQSYYNQKIEETGKELPNDEAIKAICSTDETAEGIVAAKWMRLEAAKVIAMENEGKANTTNLLMRKISQANDLVLDREKEIEDLKSQLSKLKGDQGTGVEFAEWLAKNNYSAEYQHEPMWVKYHTNDQISTKDLFQIFQKEKVLG